MICIKSFNNARVISEPFLPNLTVVREKNSQRRHFAGQIWRKDGNLTEFDGIFAKYDDIINKSDDIWQKLYAIFARNSQRDFKAFNDVFQQNVWNKVFPATHDDLIHAIKYTENACYFEK